MSFSLFMSSHGILHKSYCAYIPQQNGVPECKNRHLVEKARTLLLHHKLPQRFLGDVILSTCYLINRMSSSILHDQILILSYYLINLSFASLLVSLVVYVLFIFSLLGKTNSQSRPQSVSSWVILAFRGVIVVIHPTLIATSFLLMLPLRIPLSAPL